METPPAGSLAGNVVRDCPVLVLVFFLLLLPVAVPVSVPVSSSVSVSTLAVLRFTDVRVALAVVVASSSAVVVSSSSSWRTTRIPVSWAAVRY